MFIIEKKEVDFDTFAAFWSEKYNYAKPIEWALDNLNFGMGLMVPSDIKSLFTAKESEENSLFKFKSPMELLKGIDTFRKLQKQYDEALFQNAYGHLSIVGQIVLLQMLNPTNFPMFDAHIYRGYAFLKTGKVAELEDLTKTEQFEAYLNYKSFLMGHVSDNLSLKKADKAVWAFGKYLESEVSRNLRHHSA